MKDLKLCKVINEETKEVVIGAEEQKEIFEAEGFSFQNVEQAYNEQWYLKGYAPEKPAPTKEEVSETRRQLYIAQVDPITAHINRLKDEEQTDEVIAQIEALKAERAEVVAKIKEENPYPVEEVSDETSGV